MSAEKKLDYNSRLKPMSRKGVCGDPEYTTPTSKLNTLINQLSQLLLTSKHCVIFTGAGISTSFPASIPDFRGPRGVWTRELTGDPLKPEEKTPTLFNTAKPTFSHRAIVELIHKGYVHHVVSQNVDGLHLRSGVPSEKLSEIHGNIFMEICELCGRRYFRDYDVGGMGLNYTGNYCESTDCYGKLKDFAIDWDTDLPSEIMNQAKQQMRKSDLVICLGTSLRIRPAGNMPMVVLKPNKQRKTIGKLVIINLQETHLDDHATIRIHHYCDDVMKLLCKKLKIVVDAVESIPPKRTLRSGALKKEEHWLEGESENYFHEEDYSGMNHNHKDGQRRRKKPRLLFDEPSEKDFEELDWKGNTEDDPNPQIYEWEGCPEEEEVCNSSSEIPCESNVHYSASIPSSSSSSSNSANSDESNDHAVKDV